MKKGLFITIGIAMAFVAALAFQHSTLAQRPGGAPGGAGAGASGGQMMMMMTVPVEGMWGYISFELGVTDAELLKCRKVFQDAYTKNKGLRDKAREARGDTDAMRSLRTEMDKIKSDLDAKLKGVLTPEQMTKIAAWEKENRDRMRRAAPPGGGTPGGGTQQRGAQR